jgi:hypothetical protein
MFNRQYIGYKEGEDLTKVPAGYLTFPTKNTICHKGTAYVRGGLQNDGVEPTEDTPIAGETVWKEAPSGVQALRRFGTTIQLRIEKDDQLNWPPIFTGIAANADTVRFDGNWTDTESDYIKKRLFAVDGTDKIFEWNGAVAEVESVAGQVITIKGDRTLEQLGFDPGNTTTQNVIILRFGGTNSYVNQITATYTEAVANLRDQTLTVVGDITSIEEGDIIVGAFVTHTDKLVGVNKHEVRTYKNALGIFSRDVLTWSFSDWTTKLDFTVPGSPTATSARELQLGKFRAAIVRKDVLWACSDTQFYKVTFTEEQQETTGSWSKVEAYEQAGGKIALLYCMEIVGNSVVFLSEDKTLNQITPNDIGTLEITDNIAVISDDVEALLLRLDLDGARMFDHHRYLFITVPAESVLLMVDKGADNRSFIWQSPMTIPISGISIINGQRYGHSNGRNETFELFSGSNDFGAPIEAKMAGGYLSLDDEIRYAEFQRFGLSCWASPTTTCTVTHEYDNEGSTSLLESVFDFSQLKQFNLIEDASWGNLPWAFRQFGGADQSLPIRRFLNFDTNVPIAFLQYRPVLTITGPEVQFRLLGWDVDSQKSDTAISQELFLNA